MSLLVVGLLVFVVAVAMTMVGKGGGNFFVLILAMAGIPMHEAATTGQFILIAGSVSALVVFQRNQAVSWMLAVLVGSFCAVSALAGGYFSHQFSAFSLKMVFAAMLLVAGAIMLIPVAEPSAVPASRKFGVINVRAASAVYRVNLWLALPVTVMTGFGAGMVGVSGGSFLVPLMVLACGVPMHVAVGTASTLIALTALMGFTGHAIRGDFNPSWAVPLAMVAVLGGVLGGKLALGTKPKNLKQLFAYTNWLAALFMAANALHAEKML